MEQVRTRKQREKDLASIGQFLVALAAFAAVWAGASSRSVTVGVVVFIAGLVVVESVLLAPGIVRRRRLRRSGYDHVYNMTGEQFEEYLQAFFSGKGYRARLTPNGADFGGDLILEREGKRTVVQAKHWTHREVGIRAIQEVHAAKAYYKAEHALVVTVGSFTQQAIDLARSCEVELWDGNRLRKEVLLMGASRASVK